MSLTENKKYIIFGCWSLSLTIALLFSILIHSHTILAASLNEEIQQQCNTGSIDARERCANRLIQQEIDRRCSSGTVDARDRCITSVQQEANTASSNTSLPSIEADCKPPAGQTLNKDNCGILAYVWMFTNALTALVGIIIVIMIAIGGIQYSASRSDPGQVTAAKEKIRNAVIALVIFIFMFSFLQWLIPGGIFGANDVTYEPSIPAGSETPSSTGGGGGTSEGPAGGGGGGSGGGSF